MRESMHRNNGDAPEVEGRKAGTLYLADLKPDAAGTDHEEHESGDQRPAMPPARSFRSAKEDKTARLVIGFLGVIAVAVIMLILFSDKGRPRSRKTGEASLGRPKATETAQSGTDSIVPSGTMQPMQDDRRQPGQINASDIENTKKGRNTTTEMASNPSMGNGAKSLAQIPPFPPASNSDDNWSPPPYGEKNPEAAGDQKSDDEGLAKPSLTFTASTEKTNSAIPVEDAGPRLDLGSGSRLSARLASVVTSAVDQPVIAIIEYNYEHDGQIIIPAGSKAVGSVRQADRSGYLQLHFDHLEMPDGTSVAIEALATDTNLGPLRGKVTGTNRGKNFAVRALTGIGQTSAMLVGQNNLNGAVSEADLMRMQMAENMGQAGDEEIAQLMMMEHPIVTLPAGLRIYVVFEKSPEGRSSRHPLIGSQRGEMTNSAPSPQ